MQEELCLEMKNFQGSLNQIVYGFECHNYVAGLSLVTLGYEEIKEKVKKDNLCKKCLACKVFQKIGLIMTNNFFENLTNDIKQLRKLLKEKNKLELININI